nr:hypothetical protein Ade03nite_80590 [Actinoplanes derwentensis]
MPEGSHTFVGSARSPPRLNSNSRVCTLLDCSGTGAAELGGGVISVVEQAARPARAARERNERRRNTRSLCPLKIRVTCQRRVADITPGSAEQVQLIAILDVFG